MSHHTTLRTALDSGMIPLSKCTVFSRASWKIKGAGKEPKFSGKKMIQRGVPSRAVFLSYPALVPGVFTILFMHSWDVIPKYVCTNVINGAD